MHKIHRRLRMKKIFALLLVVLMLVPFVASCKDPDNTDTDTDSGVSSDEKSVEAAMKQYKGSTINVMAAPWTSGEAGSPWSQVELCVSDWDSNAKGFGMKINNGVMYRKEYIEDTYEVTVNWIDCKSAGMLNRLVQAAQNKGEVGEEIIHVALPHVFEAMEIVVNDALYAMGSDYIDFDAEYYNQDSLEAYSLAGRTFYAGGDISFLDEHTAHVLFYNNTVAEVFGDAFPDLYKATIEGTWTIDSLYNLSSSVSVNMDGKDEYTDDDKYGLGTTQLNCYYQYFGVYQVGKGTDTSGNEAFVLTINNDKVSTVIDKMIEANKNPKYIRTTWKDYGTMGKAFSEDRLLFYHEVLQKVFDFDDDLKVGILPFPKLSTEQERYYVPPAQQATVVCIPRATDDIVLSECMVEILSKSASEYIKPAYIAELESNIYVDPEAGEDDYTAMDVILQEVFPNLMFDLGYMYGRYGGDGDGLVTSSIQKGSVEGTTNTFSKVYEPGYNQAKTQLENWTYAYNAYEP